MAGSVHIKNIKARRGAFCLSIDELSIAPREVFAVVGEQAQENRAVGSDCRRFPLGRRRHSA